MKTVVARAMFLAGAALCCAVVQAEPNNPPPSRPLAGYSPYELKPVQLDAGDAAKKGMHAANGTVEAR